MILPYDEAYGGIMLTKKKAFTLIELLVVVLIIGILAAVAVPQYKKAVEKSRAAEAFTLMKSLEDAAAVYYLANGSYENMDLDSLDVTVNPDIIQNFYLAFGGDWVYTPTHADIIFRRGATTGAEAKYALVSELNKGKSTRRYCFSATGNENICNSLGAQNCQPNTQCNL